MKKYLFALCALGALACAQEETNGASIGIGAAVQKDVFYTKDRLSAVPLPQIEAYYEGFTLEAQKSATSIILAKTSLQARMRGFLTAGT